jgi:tetratricopeptide (TPR) repeat protein
MVLDQDGSEIDWHIGYSPPPDKFLERLEKTVKGIDTYKILSERYAKEPKNIEVVFKLARKYYDRRSAEDKALALFQEVLAIDPDGKLGTTEYGEDKVTYTEYAEYYLAAITIFGDKRNPEPMKAFIKKYPEGKILKSAYSYLSSYYRFSGTKEESTAFFNEYVSKYPDDPYVLNAYVDRIIRDKENIDRGIELAEKIKEIMKYNEDPYFMKNLGQLYCLKGTPEKAEEVYGKTFMEGQVTSLSYNLVDYANFWVEQKANTDSAIEMAELAMKLKPDNNYFVQQTASIYCRLGKTEKALELYGPSYIQKNMDKPNILTSYAYFWSGQDKNLESALEAAKKGVELSPSSSTWSALSQVYQKMKKYDEALKAAEKALELAPERSKEFYKKRIEQIKKAMAEKEKKNP